MAKLEILHPTEQLRFNNPPHLSPNEQVKYLLLPQELATWIESVTNLTNKVGFILLWDIVKQVFDSIRLDILFI